MHPLIPSALRGRPRPRRDVFRGLQLLRGDGRAVRLRRSLRLRLQRQRPHGAGHRTEPSRDADGDHQHYRICDRLPRPGPCWRRHHEQREQGSDEGRGAVCCSDAAVAFELSAVRCFLFSYVVLAL